MISLAEEGTRSGRTRLLSVPVMVVLMLLMHSSRCWCSIEGCGGEEACAEVWADHDCSSCCICGMEEHDSTEQ